MFSKEKRRNSEAHSICHFMSANLFESHLNSRVSWRRANSYKLDRKVCLLQVFWIWNHMYFIKQNYDLVTIKPGDTTRSKLQ